ncbi:HET-domain-containing protein [Sporormia fimetaria CBS 119925]|uniref:HET-domain-containing protein n=1 Tax=Sporormia fimetaria CBS 119925 TaxID=1340428 RepID=A0A6A6UXH0_9PLEO|nr:HET-domain-containing protein [Sporormia fimetaria CBS 119925]
MLKHHMIAGLDLLSDPATSPSGHSQIIQKSAACPWDILRSAYPISLDSGSLEAVSRVSLWVKDCVREHSVCGNQTGARLPTRILEIRTNREVRLHITKNETAPYACLSHCWGKDQSRMIKTTSSSLENHKQNIPWSSLPTTFRDAIHFTHALGIRYLWIDSLCILQGCANDWRREGGRMAEIYANAFITLAATKSSNCDEGMFSQPSNSCPPRSGTFFNGVGQPYKLHCRKAMKVPDKYPLLDRGWAFQERLLSKRIVHFAENELIWECLEASCCECSGPHELSFLHIFPIDKKPSFIMQDSRSTIELQDAWLQLIESYSVKGGPRALTFPIRDVFPAIQGVVKLAPPRLGKYLAGHWSSDFPRSLCWSLRLVPGPKPPDWRAPSWSWACGVPRASYWDVTDETFACARKIKPSCVVVSATTNPVLGGDDPTGQLSSGEIVLRGKCLTGWTQKNTWESTEPPALYLNGDLTRPGNQGMGSESWRQQPRWDYTFQGDQEIKVLVIQMMAGFVLQKHLDMPCQYQVWLILKPVSDSEGAKFERMGLFTSDSFLCPSSLSIRDATEEEWKTVDAVAAKLDATAEEREVTIV